MSSPYRGDDPFALPPTYPGPYPAPYPAAAQYGGYAPPSYPVAYPQPSSTPGAVVAAAALGYALAGLLVLGAVVLFLASAVLHSLFDTVHAHDGVPVEAAIDGAINLVLAAALIAGAVAVTTRRSWGRVVLVVANVAVLVDAVYWVARLHLLALAFGVFFVGVAVAGVVVALGATVRTWTMRWEPLAPPGPPTPGPPTTVV